MPTWGLISETDARTIAKTIDLIFKDMGGLTTDNISTTEIGIYNGSTSRYIRELIYSDHRNLHTHIHTAIDNEKEKPVEKPFEYCNLIIGNSTEVYNQLEDNSQQFIFVDGNHSFPAVVSDFFCYAPKVKVGGYMAFHDTGNHIIPLTGYQSGALDNPDSYVAVRKALKAIGLMNNIAPYYEGDGIKEWQLIFDEADETDQFGGICVFKKLF